MAKLSITDQRNSSFKALKKAVFGDELDAQARNDGFKILTIFGRDIDDKSYGVEVVIPAGCKQPTDIKYGIVIKEADEKTAGLLNSEAAKFYLTMLDRLTTGNFDEKHFSLEVKDGNAVLFMSGFDSKFSNELFKQNGTVKGTIVNILFMLEGKEHFYELNKMRENLIASTRADMEVEYARQIAAASSVYPSGPNRIDGDKYSNYKQEIPKENEFNNREKFKVELPPSRDDLRNRVEGNNKFGANSYDPVKKGFFSK